MARNIPRHRHEHRLWSLLLITGVATIYVSYTLTQPIAALQPTVSYHFSQSAKPVNLHWPNYGGGAIGAVDYGVLETHGNSTPIPTASIIKVLTALAVLHQKPLAAGEQGPLITITQDDIDSYHSFIARDGSVVAIELGEQLSEYDALEALLLPSANNIADTLARWAFGSIDSFNTYANNYARELGMTSTTVTDPSGFASTTVSTPHDLVLLGETAMANSIVAEIAAKPTADIPVQGSISNVNFLLGQDGIVGLKTGNNDQDLGAFLLASKQLVGGNNITIVSVIMAGPDLWAAMNDSLKLLQSAVPGFTTLSINQQTPVARYTTPWHDSSTVVPAKTQTIVVWRGASVSASVSIAPLKPSSQVGISVGSIKIMSQGRTLTSIPLVLAQSFPAPPVSWRLSHPDSRG